MSKIDFVILWVDGNDPKWLEEKNKYLNDKKMLTASASRYRDWDNLQYWFRGVEKFAPWVNNIYFITWGHVPSWLNINHPKLKIVNHKDYLDEKNLPVFNSNAIELEMHKITGLSEHFVAFNDDMFIINNVEESDFFRNGKPCDNFVENNVIAFGKHGQTMHGVLNNMDIINRHFRKRSVIRKNFFKIFNYKYGMRNFRTIFLLPWYAFCGFHNHHLPLSYCKSTFIKVWKLEKELLKKTLTHKFRTNDDITHWVMRYWQLCEGNFTPRSIKFGKYFDVSKDNSKLINYIEKQKCKTICINDTNDDIDFNKSVVEIRSAFENILPDKSSFEI